MLYLYSPKIIVLFKSSAYSLNKSQNEMSTKMCQFVVVVVVDNPRRCIISSFTTVVYVSGKKSKFQYEKGHGS